MTLFMPIESEIRHQYHDVPLQLTTALSKRFIDQNIIHNQCNSSPLCNVRKTLAEKVRFQNVEKKNMDLTPFVITFLVITLTLYDLIVVMFMKNGVSRSVSRFITVAFLRLPVVSFGCGFLCGHFTGYMHLPTQQELDMIPVPTVEKVEPQPKLIKIKAKNVANNIESN